MKIPSCSFKAPTSCCISGSPPSPEGEHPRLPSHPNTSVDRPKLAGRWTSTDPTPMWGMAKGLELHAITKDDLDDGTDGFKSVPYRGTAEFRDVLGLEDVSDSDQDSVRIKSKKSSSTLKTVTQRLKKHLSQNSALNKRHSRSSIGTSEEEIERRAELRRIRQKRIQEELSLEEIHDEDDTKSASSVIVSPISPPTVGRQSSSWIPGSFVPLPLLTHPVLQLPKLSLPHISSLHVSPPDKSSEGSTTGHTSRRWSDPHSSITRFNSDHSERSLSRRYSSPVLIELGVTKTEPHLYGPSHQGSATLIMPPQPVLHATRLPSFVLPARSSWRLSFEGDDRGTTLRKLSQGRAVPVTLDADLLRSSSPPPNRGLHAAGFRFSSQVILSSDDNSNLGSLPSHLKTSSSDQAFRGVDGSPMTRLHGSIISRQGVSRALRGSSSSPQLSNDSLRRNTSNLSGSSHAQGSRLMATTTDSELSKRLLQSWGQVVPSQGSSIYHSINNSSQESRQSSRFNLLSLLSGSKNNISAEEYRELIPSQISLLGSPPTNLSSTNLTIPLTRNTYRSNIDDSSLLTSETSSFREREVELKAIQTRFASAEGRRVQSSPVSSKFREEFNSEIEDTTLRQPEQRRPSPFSKLSKFAIRSYDGAKLEELLDIPVPRFDLQELKTPGPQTTGLWSPFGIQQDAAAINVWGRALKTGRFGDDQYREGVDYFNLPISRKRSSLAPRQKSAIEEELPVSVLGNLTQLGKSKKRPTFRASYSKDAAEEYSERLQERLALKELVMDSWEEEMATNATKAQARSRHIVGKSKPVGPDRRYPATWSRFPSHTRSERSASAGPSNNVEVRDFAILGNDNGEITWCLGHDDKGHHSEIGTPTLKGVGHQVKERVNYKAYKIDTAHRQAFERRGQRGSLTTSSGLEYPELEMLAVTRLTAEQMAAREEEEARAARGKAKEEKLDDLIALFGRDGPSDEGEALFMYPAQERVSVENDRSEDTIFHQKGKLPEEHVLSVAEPANVNTNKFKTWNGKDFDGYWYEGKRIGPDSDIFGKMELHASGGGMMDMFEQEEMLQAVKDAWLRGSEYATD